MTFFRMDCLDSLFCNNSSTSFYFSLSCCLTFIYYSLILPIYSSFWWIMVRLSNPYLYFWCKYYNSLIFSFKSFISRRRLSFWFYKSIFSLISLFLSVINPFSLSFIITCAFFSFSSNLARSVFWYYAD